MDEKHGDQILNKNLLVPSEYIEISKFYLERLKEQHSNIQVVGVSESQQPQHDSLKKSFDIPLDQVYVTLRSLNSTTTEREHSQKKYEEELLLLSKDWNNLTEGFFFFENNSLIFLMFIIIPS